MKDETDGKSGKKAGADMDRRDFLRLAAAAAGSAVLAGCGLSKDSKKFAVPERPAARSGKPRAIFIAIDSLHPAYLTLNARGFAGGRDGDWLMPNVNRFLKDTAFYPRAACYLPSATDMNHLNALSGANSGSTGILGVYCQPVGWGSNGKIELRNLHLSMAKDTLGNRVDTLFSAFKRRWPDSVTAMVSGKFWISDMFRSTPDFNTAVDWPISAMNFPGFIAPPKKGSFADPATDSDGPCDPESPSPFLIAPDNKAFDLQTMINRRLSGQKKGLSRVMEKRPDRFPHDEWVVDATLALYERERPDMGYVLLGQADDAGHCLGAAWDPSEFAPTADIKLPKGCPENPDYRLASIRNSDVWREPVLDAMRDVDHEFGRLVDGLGRLGVLEDATVVVLSDHSMETHRKVAAPDATDVLAILKSRGLDVADYTAVFTVSSCGLMYFREKKEIAARVKKVLSDYAITDPVSGKSEQPFRVLDRADMKAGVPGVNMAGELYHEFLLEKDMEKSLLWPDLAIFCRNGWQLPVYAGAIANIAFKIPKWTPPFLPFLGGHGSVETLPILAAIRSPKVSPGVFQDEIRIADLGVTAAGLCGLSLRSAAVGRNLF